jgi:RND family efflux transporter MFP subunit
MNTQIIPQPKKRFATRLGIPLAIILITACILVYASWASIRSTIMVEAVTVVMRNVETNNPQSTAAEQGSIVQAPGWVEAEPFSVYAGALTPGIIESILVLEGDVVEKGQPIAKLISDDNTLAFKAAEATESLWLGKLKAANANMQELADEYNRKKPLADAGALAKGPVERLRLRQQTGEANIDIAKASLREATAAKETAQLALNRCVVRSPMDGVVMELLASPGSVIRFGSDEHSTHILHLYDPMQLQVRSDVPLTDLAYVSVGHPAQIIVDVLPNTTFEGEVLRFVHRADQQKNTVEAKVKIINPSPLLKPDMLARVKILQPTREVDDAATWIEQHVFIPKSAIADISNPVVWIVADLKKAIGNAQPAILVLGEQEFDGWIEVLSGLSTGDRIITSDINFKQGDVVQIIGGQ